MSGKKRAFSPSPSRESSKPPTISRFPAGQEDGKGPRAPGVESDVYYRDLYQDAPDFRQLAEIDPDFAACLSHGQLDFTEPNSVLQLTKTLLKHDFGIEIEMPDDRLCPPVPNRHNYILWLKALMDTTSYDEPGRKLCGLDIGTGASAIYPLLGCTQRQWYFVATDIDEKNLAFAKKNVALNSLQSRVKIVGRKRGDSLIPLDDLDLDSIDFVMTNPPFYTSQEELVESAKQKSRPPFSACTGAPVEMITDGGEVKFVLQIIRESLQLRERVQWYTAMLGKHSSVETIIEALKTKGITNYAATEFVQGLKTRRWAVGWSFSGLRPSQDVCRGLTAPFWKKLLPPPVELEALRSTSTTDVGALADAVARSIGTLDLISWVWDRETLRGVGRAEDKVWGRFWRRKHLHKQSEETDAADRRSRSSSEESEACALGFSVFIRVARSEVTVTCRWLEGDDATLFASFRGFLGTQLKEFRT